MAGEAGGDERVVHGRVVVQDEVLLGLATTRPARSCGTGRTARRRTGLTGPTTWPSRSPMMRAAPGAPRPRLVGGGTGKDVPGAHRVQEGRTVVNRSSQHQALALGFRYGRPNSRARSIQSCLACVSKTHVSQAGLVSRVGVMDLLACVLRT